MLRKLKTYKKKNKSRHTKKKGGWKNTNKNFELYKQTKYGKVANFFELMNIVLNDIREALKKLFGDKPLPGFEKRTATTITNFELSDEYDYRNLFDYIPYEDDGDYSQLKWTKIKAGTIFYRRQKTTDFERIKWRDVWLDYTSRINNSYTPKKSFLIEQLNENINNTRIQSTKAYFGKYLLKLKANKDLIVLHFPDAISSYTEDFIRRLAYERQTYLSSIDGYTLDFLEFNPNKIYKNLPSIKGYRELKLHNTDVLDLVSVNN